jgi:sortase A
MSDGIDRMSAVDAPGAPVAEPPVAPPPPAAPMPPPVEVAYAPQPSAAGADPDARSRTFKQAAIGGILALLLLVIGFFGYLLWITPMLQSSSQSDLLTAFRQSLVLDDTPQLVTPPDGKPLGVLQIPDLGVTQVMVQGISSSDTKLGPGHDPSTPAPGQAGNALIVGRRTTYGASFQKLADVRPGMAIFVVTRQGRFEYIVDSHSMTTFGDPTVAKQVAGTNEMTMITAGPGIRPSTEQVVRAKLRGEGLQAPGPLPSPPAGQRPGQSTGESNWGWILLWGQALVLTLVGAWYLYRRGWSAAVTYLLTTPLLLTFAFLFYGAVDTLLPPTL